MWSRVRGMGGVRVENGGVRRVIIAGQTQRESKRFYGLILRDSLREDESLRLDGGEWGE